MATCCRDAEKPLGLYSTGKMYTCGHSVAFRIVDVGQACASDGIALTISERESEPFTRPGALFVNISGELVGRCLSSAMTSHWFSSAHQVSCRIQHRHVSGFKQIQGLCFVLRVHTGSMFCYQGSYRAW